MKRLSELVDCPYDFQIVGVADDSRNVRAGYLFVATHGYYVDHFNFINDAINNGAVAVVVDRKVECSVPVIVVQHINDFFVDVCCKFYDIDLDNFNFIGITGTDGKTTTATVVAEILSSVDIWAYIGTNGVKIGDIEYPTNNTTPGGCELFECLSLIKRCGCNNIVMEVSSEALLHDRLKLLKFDIIGFTNITEDHLNVHKTLDNYRNCKFNNLNLLNNDGLVVVNGDDVNCRLIYSDNLYSFGMNDDNFCIISDVKEASNRVNFSLAFKDNIYVVSSPLLGMYNVYNVTMAFIICMLKGININCLINSIENLSIVRGRREYLDFGQEYDIILDYAHTYNGVKCLLESVSEYKKIITVTGAAGGREREKRSSIGKLIMDKSSVSIFTMDDPRFEKVDDIIDQMVSGSDKGYLRIIDRREAIYKALLLADVDSVVLIIGKGRDNYMAIEDRKEPYSDYDVINEYFNQ